MVMHKVGKYVESGVVSRTSKHKLHHSVTYSSLCTERSIRLAVVILSPRVKNNGCCNKSNKRKKCTHPVYDLYMI